jgi:hypothetical protein
MVASRQLLLLHIFFQKQNSEHTRQNEVNSTACWHMLMYEVDLLCATIAAVLVITNLIYLPGEKKWPLGRWGGEGGDGRHFFRAACPQPARIPLARKQKKNKKSQVVFFLVFF